MQKEELNKIQVCRFLKSKNSFGMLEGDGNWSGVEDPNASFWCNKTAGAVGPDNMFAGVKVCVTGRKCYAESEY